MLTDEQFEAVHKAWYECGIDLLGGEWSKFAAKLSAAPAAQPDEPNWRHPKIQALIAADARNRICIDLIWQVLEDPDGERTASDMEYWDAIHDAVRAKIKAAPDAKQEPMTDEQILEFVAVRTEEEPMFIRFARAIERYHGIKDQSNVQT
jgi:hypothetical protein